MASRNVEAALLAPDLLHLLSVFTLGLAFLEPQLLEEDVSRIEYTACIATVGTLVAHEAGKLSRLNLTGSLVGMVLSMEVAAELCPSDTRYAKMSSYLFTYFVAGIVDLDGIFLFTFLELDLHNRIAMGKIEEER